MKNLYHSDFIASLKNDITKAKKSIILISPYITLPAVDNLLSVTTAARLEKSIVTLPFGVEYLTGAVELQALKELQKSGFSLMSLPQLHSKIYIIDYKTAYIGSANFTGKGWGLVGSSNVEVMTKVSLSAADVNEIKATYLNRCSPLELSEELEQIISEGKDFRNSYQQLEKKIVVFVKEKTTPSDQKNRYQTFLQNLKDEKTIVSFAQEKDTKQFGKNVFHVKKQGSICSAKLMYSRLGAPDKTYRIIYNFELTKTGGDQAKKNNLDFIMILEGSEGNKQRYVKIPATFMRSKVLKSVFLNKRSKSWQFTLNDDENGLSIRCFNQSGEEQKINISNYENNLFGS